eukprot:SAG11_NODE_9264_length_927_cov_2.298309_1_plen_21_part_10
MEWLFLVAIYDNIFFANVNSH